MRGSFTPLRAVTQFAVDMTNPRLGETVLDPACGTGGFLTCAYEHLKAQAQTPPGPGARPSKAFRGWRKKQLPHLLCVTNMMVHGIEVPTNIRHDNTLRRPLRDYGPRDWVDVVVTNPPFGGMEEDGIEGGFPSEFRTRETADLFLVLVMDVAEAGGPGGDRAAGWHLVWRGHQDAHEGKAAARLQLAHHCSACPMASLTPTPAFAPTCCFSPRGSRRRRCGTTSTPIPKATSLTPKTKPMRVAEFAPEKAWWHDRQESEQAWKVAVADIIANGYNLDIKNPNTPEDTHEDPVVLLGQYQAAVTAAVEARRSLKESLMAALEREDA
jgi:type I restriction enzyme M protein